MTTTTAPVAVASKRRSNRTITEFACRQLYRFVMDDLAPECVIEQKNTEVRHVRYANLRLITISLYGEEILRLSVTGKKAMAITISFTSFFDSLGQPTTTTSERLNGLLDSLGWLGMIPRGVRLFRGDPGVTYLGRGDDKVAVGQHLLRSVHIVPNGSRLIFAAGQ